MPARPRRRLSRRWSKVSKRFGIAGLAFGAWGLFYPRPLPLVVPLLAITPVTAVVASLASNQELDPFDEPERAFGLATFCVLPPIALSLVDLRFFPLLEGWRLLGFGAVSGVIIGLLYLKVRPASFTETRTSIWQQIAGWLGAIVYGWILVVAANGLGPQGARAVYKVPILKMRVESGKNTSYYLTLPPFGPVREIYEWSVPGGFYRRQQVGGSVCISIYPGALGEPWYEPHRCAV